MDEALVKSSDSSVSCRFFYWWPLLLGPIAMVLVYIANGTDTEGLFSSRTNEGMALILVGTSVVLFALQAIIFRSEFHLFMAVLCAAFFCREWHFYGTSRGIYIALVLLGIWAVIRRVDFARIVGNGHLKIWIVTMMATYLLSQLIARRVFKHIPILPNEAHLHIPLEETMETLAHLTMIVVCIIALKARPQKQG
jgi:hypothetical protein